MRCVCVCLSFVLLTLNCSHSWLTVRQQNVYSNMFPCRMWGKKPRCFFVFCEKIYTFYIGQFARVILLSKTRHILWMHVKLELTNSYTWQNWAKQKLNKRATNRFGFRTVFVCVWIRCSWSGKMSKVSNHEGHFEWTSRTFSVLVRFVSHSLS